MSGKRDLMLPDSELQASDSPRLFASSLVRAGIPKQASLPRQSPLIFACAPPSERHTGEICRPLRGLATIPARARCRSGVATADHWTARRSDAVETPARRDHARRCQSALRAISRCATPAPLGRRGAHAVRTALRTHRHHAACARGTRPPNQREFPPSSAISRAHSESEALDDAGSSCRNETRSQSTAPPPTTLHHHPSAAGERRCRPTASWSGTWGNGNLAG